MERRRARHLDRVRVGMILERVGSCEDWIEAQSGRVGPWRRKQSLNLRVGNGNGKGRGRGGGVERGKLIAATGPRGTREDGQMEVRTDRGTSVNSSLCSTGAGKKDGAN